MSPSHFRVSSTLATGAAATALLLSMPALGHENQYEAKPAMRRFAPLGIASSRVLADAITPSLYTVSGTGFSGLLFEGEQSATGVMGSIADSEAWNELLSLGPNWDSSGAVAVSSDAVRHAKLFLESLGTLGSTFEPFAHPDGSVGLEARKDASSAYLIASDDNRFAYVIRVGDAVHRGNAVTPSKMREILALVY